MTVYTLEFVAKARKQWRGLDHAIKSQLQRKLAERLETPHVPSARVRDVRNGYKIKLRKAGIRLIYTVIEERVVLLVLSVGERDGETAYDDAVREMAKRDD